MKKLFLFLVVVSFFSCSKEPKSDLVGVWEMNSFDSDYYSLNTHPGEEDFTEEADIFGIEYNSTIEFKEEPNVYIQTGIDSIQYDFYLNGEHAITFKSAEDASASGTWSREDNVLTTISENGDTTVVDLILENNQLQFDSEVEEYTAVLGATQTAITTTTIKYTKK